MIKDDLKIALCLSGQARFLEQAYSEVIYPFVLKNNNIDVYIHTCSVDEKQEGKISWYDGYSDKKELGGTWEKSVRLWYKNA
jgi:hypothetical protein